MLIFKASNKSNKSYEYLQRKVDVEIRKKTIFAISIEKNSLIIHSPELYKRVNSEIMKIVFFYVQKIHQGIVTQSSKLHKIKTLYTQIKHFCFIPYETKETSK